MTQGEFTVRDNQNWISEGGSPGTLKAEAGLPLVPCVGALDMLASPGLPHYKPSS